METRTTYIGEGFDDEVIKANAEKIRQAHQMMEAAVGAPCLVTVARIKPDLPESRY